MDPILVAAVRDGLTRLHSLTQQGVSVSPEQMEEFYRSKTGGKYGAEDANKLIGSIDTGVGPRNVGRSLAQGALFNWMDEIEGKLPKFLGGGADAENETRLREQMYNEAHPVANTAGKIVGGLAGLLVPGGAEAKGAQLLIKGAALGAGAGAVAGAGEGEDASSRVHGAETGAVVGGTLGTLAPGLASAIRYFRDPAAIGARKIASAVEQSGGAGKVMAGVDRLAAAGRGDQTMLADATSPLRQAADYAANTSDEVHVPLAEKTAARQADMTDRLLQDVKAKVGAPHAPSILEQRGKDLQSWASGPDGFGGLRESNPVFDVNPIADKLSKPVVANSWKLARMGGDIEAGEPIDALMQKILATNPKLSQGGAKDAADAMRAMAQNESAATGRALNPEMADPEGPRPPSFGDLQAMKEILDARIEKAFATPGGGNVGAALKNVRDALVEGLQESVPNYKQVLATYHTIKSGDRALQAGVDAWNSGDRQAIANEVAALDPDKLALYRQGMASELIRHLDNKALNQNVAKQLQEGGNTMQQKLETVFGDQQTFEHFMEQVRAERDLSRLQRATGGSETARRTMAQEGADPTELAMGALHAPAGVASAILHGAQKASKSATQRAAAAQMGPMLMTQGQDAIHKFLQQTLPGALQPRATGFENLNLPLVAGRTGQSLMSSF